MLVPLVDLVVRLMAVLAFWRAGRQARALEEARRIAAARAAETQAALARPGDRDELVERLRRDGL